MPADITLAACKAVLLLYQFRQTGIPQGSESWNGYSINYSQPFTADAAIRTPASGVNIPQAQLLPLVAQQLGTGTCAAA